MENTPRPWQAANRGDFWIGVILFGAMGFGLGTIAGVLLSKQDFDQPPEFIRGVNYQLAETLGQGAKLVPCGPACPGEQCHLCYGARWLVEQDMDAPPAPPAFPSSGEVDAFQRGVKYERRHPNAMKYPSPEPEPAEP